jgi:hypothetical protein
MKPRCVRIPLPLRGGALLAGVLLVGCVHAPDATLVMPTSLAAESTPETHRQAALALFEVMELRELLDQSVATALENALRINPSLRPFEGVMREFFRRYMSLEAIAEPMAELYVESFSELELRQMTWFYGTDVGRRAVAEMPGLMRRGGELGEALVAEHEAELQESIRRFIAEHPGALGTPP